MPFEMDRESFEEARAAHVRGRSYPDLEAYIARHYVDPDRIQNQFMGMAGAAPRNAAGTMRAAREMAPMADKGMAPMAAREMAPMAAKEITPMAAMAPPKPAEEKKPRFFGLLQEREKKAGKNASKPRMAADAAPMRRPEAPKRKEGIRPEEEFEAEIRVEARIFNEEAKACEEETRIFVEEAKACEEETRIFDEDAETCDEVTADFDFEKHESALNERMTHLSDTYQEYLLYLIENKGMTNAEVYKRAIVDKKVFAKIKANPDYHPKKMTALCLCVGAKLNLDETKDLLARAGYALSPCDKTDVIFSYFIENGIYDMIEIDVQLEEHGLPCIIA